MFPRWSSRSSGRINVVRLPIISKIDKGVGGMVKISRIRESSQRRLKGDIER